MYKFGNRGFYIGETAETKGPRLTNIAPPSKPWPAGKVPAYISGKWQLMTYHHIRSKHQYQKIIITFSESRITLESSVTVTLAIRDKNNDRIVTFDNIHDILIVDLNGDIIDLITITLNNGIGTYLWTPAKKGIFKGNPDLVRARIKYNEFVCPELIVT
jgi:hypothetical protein